MSKVHIGIDVDHGRNLVIVGFDRKMEWVELDADTAVQLAEALVHGAQKFHFPNDFKSTVAVNVEADIPRKKVILAMTENVQWLELNPDDAIRFADAVVRKALVALGSDPDSRIILQ